LNSVSGEAAEAHACAHLQAAGLTLVCRNYRCRGGEIDLVMRDGETVVFVEVRFRASARFGTALESVDRRKRARLVVAALHYLQHNRVRAPCRFDVVGLGPERGGSGLEWIRDAFSLG
jgi:putative endonuclease